MDGGGICCKEKYFKIFTFYNLKVAGGEEKITSSVSTISRILCVCGQQQESCFVVCNVRNDNSNFYMFLLIYILACLSSLALLASYCTKLIAFSYFYISNYH